MSLTGYRSHTSGYKTFQELRILVRVRCRRTYRVIVKTEMYQRSMKQCYKTRFVVDPVSRFSHSVMPRDWDNASFHEDELEATVSATRTVAVLNLGFHVV
jgi:hypothetical protein